jgi:hypothetical protein
VFTLRFSPTGSLGFWLGVHYRRGGRFFCFAGFSEVVGFLEVAGFSEVVGPRGFLGGPKGEINFKG